MIIEMDGKKVFEEESEFAHVPVGTRDESDKGYNQISGLVGTIKTQCISWDGGERDVPGDERSM